MPRIELESVPLPSLSPYLAILESELSSDLQRTIKPEDLRFTVRNALFKEVLRQAATALGEMDNSIRYYSHDEKQNIADEIKLARHIGYLNEMLKVRAAQRIDVDHQLEAGDSTDAE